MTPLGNWEAQREVKPDHEHRKQAQHVQRRPRTAQLDQGQYNDEIQKSNDHVIDPDSSGGSLVAWRLAENFSGCLRCIMPKVVFFLIAVLVVIALAEVAPEIVNAVLVLVFVGILLMRFDSFKSLINSIGTLGK